MGGDERTGDWLQLTPTRTPRTVGLPGRHSSGVSAADPDVAGAMIARTTVATAPSTSKLAVRVSSPTSRAGSLAKRTDDGGAQITCAEVASACWAVAVKPGQSSDGQVLTRSAAKDGWPRSTAVSRCGSPMALGWRPAQRPWSYAATPMRSWDCNVTKTSGFRQSASPRVAVGGGRDVLGLLPELRSVRREWRTVQGFGQIGIPIDRTEVMARLRC